MQKLLYVLGAVTVFVSHTAVCATSVTVRASSAGGRLNSDLLKGGGADDTVALQTVLAQAADGTPVHLIVDGAALVGGLNVYGNTTIECINGGGLYLKDNSSRAIIRNAHRSRAAVTDAHITVRGCFLNGNRKNQPTAARSRPDMPTIDTSPASGFVSNQEADGTFLAGLQFFGVSDLNIEKVTLWNIRAFGVMIANADRVNIKDVIIDHGGGPNADRVEYSMTDGLHFKGPASFITIDNVKIRVGDDALAFSPNDYETDDLTVRDDFGPYVGQGPITDVIVSNVHLMNTHLGIRLLSTNERIDRISINHVTGSVRMGAVVTLSHWMNPTSMGNFGAISISDLNVERSSRDSPDVVQRETVWKERSAKSRAISVEMNGGVMPFVYINSPVENLSLRNIATTVRDDRPIVKFGPDAKVRLMTADLTLQDPQRKAVPVELGEGSSVDRLYLSVKQQQNGPLDQGSPPIVSLGGAVGQLHWIDTPPLYVNALLSRNDAVDVTFSQDVKALDFKAGVRIQVNGQTAEISRTLRLGAGEVRYVVAKAIRSGATITWAYDAVEGNIQNLSGDPLLSVSEKEIARGAGL